MGLKKGVFARVICRWTVVGRSGGLVGSLTARNISQDLKVVSSELRKNPNAVNFPNDEASTVQLAAMWTQSKQLYIESETVRPEDHTTEANDGQPSDISAYDHP